MKGIKIIFALYFLVFSGFSSVSNATELVFKTQFLLKELGYNVGQIDGIYGKKTATALSEFYSSKIQKFDGKLDANEVIDLSKAAKKLTIFTYRPHITLCKNASKKRKKEIASTLLRKYLLDASQKDITDALKCASGLDNVTKSNVYGIPKLTIENTSRYKRVYRRVRNTSKN